MLYRTLIAPLALSAALVLTSGTNAADPTYPNWKGQWNRERFPGVGAPFNPGFDPSKPFGRGQQIPLTPEYEAVFEESLADQAAGGHGNFPSIFCMAQGMPLVMIPFQPLEFIVTPETTYILIDTIDHTRRIFTDGRDWPDAIPPTYLGYSIGRWIDEDGDGRYNVLEVETRGFKGPRAFDASGLPLHHDNQSIFKERIYLDKNNPGILHDEMTVIDHALTHPWSIDKKYIRSPNPRPVWSEMVCPETNAHVLVGKEDYMISGDGFLMPVKKGQAPPDLRYFPHAPQTPRQATK
jgi:hypothetical protein